MSLLPEANLVVREIRQGVFAIVSYKRITHGKTPFRPTLVPTKTPFSLCPPKN